jgi:hypothetical protein
VARTNSCASDTITDMSRPVATRTSTNEKPPDSN